MKASQNTPQIEWRIEFETGHPAIDHEHKEMIERINGFLAMTDNQPDAQQVLESLGDIYAWISAHFALEETTMRAQNYPEFAAHKEDHESLLDELRDIMDDIEQYGYARVEQTIQTMLSDWFINHFKTHDALWHSKSTDNEDK